MSEEKWWQRNNFKWIIAHRGGSSIAPENTLEAFRTASRSVTVLEVDIQISIDNVLFVMHDFRLEGTTNGRGEGRNYTIDQLKQLDSGYSYTNDGLNFPHRDKGFKIPTFDEFLDEFANQEHLTFIIDVKTPTAAIPTLVKLQEIERQIPSLHNRIMLCAVGPETNQILLANKPDHYPLFPDFTSVLKFVILSRLRLANWLYNHKHEVFGSIYAINFQQFRTQTRGSPSIKLKIASWLVNKLIGEVVVTPNLVNDAKQKGIPFFVFGAELDQPNAIEYCLNSGVDGILSDDPLIAANTYNTWAQQQTIPGLSATVTNIIQLLTNNQ
eukprot:TRINITY_DN1642_c1_g1_i1.p1 TRINITY_DN1642_c1_g1~~TRINITY_DN1642_c1_g1_i1.p1  ORF type:complete len:326 (-),score=147.39 TRINITY_DN1642_c1_g1_i1:963-1940(-)